MEPFLVADIGLLGTLLGTYLGWRLNRRTALATERDDRFRQDLASIRDALEAYIEVLHGPNGWPDWPQYHRRWLDVVLAIGRLSRYVDVSGRGNRNVLRLIESTPGREMLSGEPRELERIAREAISMLDELEP